MQKLSDVSGIALVVGIIMLAICFWLSYLVVDRYIVHGNTVSAIVTSEYTIARRRFSIPHCPVIKFTTLDNQQVEHSSLVCAGKHTFEVGQVVDVIYDSRDPQKVVVKNLLWIGWTPLVLLIFGTFLTWAGARNKA